MGNNVKKEILEVLLINSIVMNTNNLKLMAIPQLKGKHFFIPDYQRGYKWEKDQVYALLRDLWRYFKSGIKQDFYCLQPIVVKECSQ